MCIWSHYPGIGQSKKSRKPHNMGLSKRGYTGQVLAILIGPWFLRPVGFWGNLISVSRVSPVIVGLLAHLVNGVKHQGGKEAMGDCQARGIRGQISWKDWKETTGGEAHDPTWSTRLPARASGVAMGKNWLF